MLIAASRLLGAEAHGSGRRRDEGIFCDDGNGGLQLTLPDTRAPGE
jgi:hypothetical protein